MQDVAARIVGLVMLGQLPRRSSPSMKALQDLGDGSKHDSFAAEQLAKYWITDFEFRHSSGISFPGFPLLREWPRTLQWQFS